MKSDSIILRVDTSKLIFSIFKYTISQVHELLGLGFRVTSLDIISYHVEPYFVNNEKNTTNIMFNPILLPPIWAVFSVL